MNRLILFIVLLSGSTIYSQNYINFLNPKQGNWTKKPGNFSNIKVTLYPSGIYCKADLEFELTTQGTNWVGVSDSLEAELLFRLPQKSVIVDAYLWMYNQPVRAKLYERTKAKMIYESLVKRRVDPLIIYEADGKSFECRVFPIVNPATRKVKLTILYPLHFTDGGIEMPFDFGMFNTGNALASRPNITLEIMKNTFLGYPSLEGYNSINEMSDRISYQFTGSTGSTMNFQNVYFNNPLKNDFLIRQPISSTEGYYQMIVKPPLSGVKKQIVFVIDYETSGSNIQIGYEKVISMMRKQVNFLLNDSDEFNLIWSAGENTHIAFSNWKKGDSASVMLAFNSITSSSSTNSVYFLSLQNAINFLNLHGQSGSIYMMSNCMKQQGSFSLQNQLVTSLMNSSQGKYPIHVLDYCESVNSNWTGSSYSYNNQYFFQNITSYTGGNYTTYLNINNNSWNYTANYTMGDLISRSMLGLVTTYDYFTADVSQTASKFQTFTGNSSYVFPSGNAYTETGRYKGISDFTVTCNYGLNGNANSFSRVLQSTDETDSVTSKIWASLYLAGLLKDNADQTFRSLIINTSFKYNVLCTQTAFLALEPDTVNQGSSSNQPTTVALAEAQNGQPAELSMTVYPNPFEGALAVKIHLDNEMKEGNFTVKLMNMVGEEIKRLTGITGSDDEWTLTLLDTNDAALPPGIYFVQVDIAGVIKTLKVIHK